MNFSFKSFFLLLLSILIVLPSAFISFVEAEEVFFVRGDNYPVGHMPQAVARTLYWCVTMLKTRM